MVKGKCNSAPIPQGHGLAPALGLFHILSQLPEAALALYSFRLTAADIGREDIEPKARDSSTAIFPFPSNSFFNSSIKYFSALLRYVPFL